MNFRAYILLHFLGKFTEFSNKLLIIFIITNCMSGHEHEIQPKAYAIIFITENIRFYKKKINLK